MQLNLPVAHLELRLVLLPIVGGNFSHGIIHRERLARGRLVRFILRVLDTKQGAHNT